MKYLMFCIMLSMFACNDEEADKAFENNRLQEASNNAKAVITSLGLSADNIVCSKDTIVGGYYCTVATKQSDSSIRLTNFKCDYNRVCHIVTGSKNYE